MNPLPFIVAFILAGVAWLIHGSIESIIVYEAVWFSFCVVITVINKHFGRKW